MRNAVGAEKMPAGSASETIPLPEAKSVKEEHYGSGGRAPKTSNGPKSGKKGEIYGKMRYPWKWKEITR